MNISEDQLGIKEDISSQELIETSKVLIKKSKVLIEQLERDLTRCKASLITAMTMEPPNLDG